MADRLSSEVRSALMGRIRARDTQPELTVRRLLHSMGYRYRLHRRDLPGNPDLVLHGRRKVIFVHGCFWHQHSGCRHNRVPDSNRDYWEPKLARNVRRDREARTALVDMGWDVMIVWECETSEQRGLRKRLQQFLNRRVENHQ